VKNFLFITTNNLSTNPRLLKEIHLAIFLGNRVTVCMFHLGNWSDYLNLKHIQELRGVTFLIISATHKPLVPWLISSIFEKIARKLPISLLTKNILSVAVGKRSWLIQKSIHRINGPFDWVIAHNPAAFYPAMKIAKMYKAALGIDVEDYHPGETKNKKMQVVTLELMKQVLPEAHYCSYAAPLIMKEIHQEIPGLKNQQLVLLNSFPEKEFQYPKSIQKSALQLVWYSQNIDFGRGLEPLIEAVDTLYPQIELNLIGNVRSRFMGQIIACKKGIKIHGVMSQYSLHSFLAHCDVGLALDIPINHNRELALTNKIITYAQAGLFILATDISPHKDFLEYYKLRFNLFNVMSYNILDILSKLIENKSSIRSNRMETYLQSKKFAWEKICLPLKHEWEKI